MFDATTTLPLPPTVAIVIAFALMTALLYGVLSLFARRDGAPMWESLSAGWLALAVPLAVAWLGAFLLTILATFVGLWGMVHGQSANFALGGLIAALLGAPFVIWGTVLKWQTVRYQKEGHMTDRISKAVEQLGAEKTVDRIGRPVTIFTGEAERISYGNPPQG